MHPKIVSYHFYMAAAKLDEYVEGTYDLRLTSDVIGFIADGWQPFGAPFVFKDCICQALVKYEGVQPSKADVEKNDDMYAFQQRLERGAQHPTHPEA